MRATLYSWWQLHKIFKISFCPSKFKLYKISTSLLLFEKPLQTQISTSLWFVLKSKICVHIVSSIQIVSLQSQSTYLVARCVVLRAVMLKMWGFIDATTYLLLNINSYRILDEGYSIRSFQIFISFHTSVLFMLFSN